MTFESDIAQSLTAFKAEIDALHQLSGHFIIISNKIGMDNHADTEISRKVTNSQNWANQYVAAQADETVLIISGLPLYPKRLV